MICLKSFRLNSINNYDKNFKYLNSIQNNTVILMDEFDSMYSPTTSTLNYPLDSNESDSRKLIHNFIVDIILIILKINNFEKVYFINSVKASDYLINEVFPYFNQELKTKKNENYLNFSDFLEYLQNKESIENKNDEIVKEIGIYYKVYKCLCIVLTKLYNKDYGFGSTGYNEIEEFIEFHISLQTNQHTTLNFQK